MQCCAVGEGGGQVQPSSNYSISLNNGTSADLILLLRKDLNPFENIKAVEEAVVFLGQVLHFQIDHIFIAFFTSKVNVHN